MTKRYKIHPSIGIARVGTSTEFFLGPEIPGAFARPADGRYRDGAKKLRRQAARFWVFEHDDEQPAAAARPVFAGEGGVARIEWTVHLANKKAIWFEFDAIAGITGDPTENAPYPPDWPLRNRNWIPTSQPDERRRRLIINPGPRTLTGADQRVEIERGNGGGFAETWPGPLVGGKEITSLGTMATDERGRLMVAGGFGTSGAAEADAMPADGRLDFVNNDKWFDDVSDGPVTARLVFDDGTSAEVTPSWVIVGPPDYAPPIEHIVTAYDVLYDMAVRKLGFDPTVFDPEAGQFRADFRPSFTKHIYPILKRAFEYRWVITQAASHPPAMVDFDELGAAPQPGEDPQSNVRSDIFDRVRDPDDLNGPNSRSMPRLHNDGTGGVEPQAFRLTVTRTQFEMLRRWARGQFIADWQGVPAPATEVTADGLDRAAAEGACGGGFFPGMEVGWVLRNPAIYAEAFRLRHAASEEEENGVTAGDMTKRSALPWQADFLKCGNNWWPAQRPNQVRVAPNSAAAVEWSRGINGHVDLVDRWALLGVVVPAQNPASPSKFHESEREIT